MSTKKSDLSENYAAFHNFHIIRVLLPNEEVVYLRLIAVTSGSSRIGPRMTRIARMAEGEGSDGGV